jgi:hypothetical protein
VSECSAPGCSKPARGRYCEAHWKRLQRRRPLDAPLQRRAAEDLDGLEQAALRLADAEGQEEYLAARDALRKASDARSLARGWRPPGLRVVASALDNGKLSKSGT